MIQWIRMNLTAFVWMFTGALAGLFCSSQMTAANTANAAGIVFGVILSALISLYVYSGFPAKKELNRLLAGLFCWGVGFGISTGLYLLALIACIKC